MIHDIYTNTYVKVCYKIFGKDPINHKLHKLVKVSKLSIENLVISIKLLYHFQTNAVVKIDDTNLVTNLIIISYILSNKLYNDQSYTFKTWIDLIQASKIRGIDMKLLKQVEVFFLNVIDYNMNFKYMVRDDKFWGFVGSMCEDGRVFEHYLLQLEKTENSTKSLVATATSPAKQMETPLTSPLITPLVTPDDSPMKKRKVLTPMYNYNTFMTNPVPTIAYPDQFTSQRFNFPPASGPASGPSIGTGYPLFNAPLHLDYV